MFVIKRNGTKEAIDAKKITSKLKYFCTYPTQLSLSQALIDELVDKIGLYRNIPTSEIDELVGRIAYKKVDIIREYGILAARIVINNHHKNTKGNFIDRIKILYFNKDPYGKNLPMISDTYYKFAKLYYKEIELHMDYERDYLMDYFGFKTLQKSYLLAFVDKSKSSVIQQQGKYIKIDYDMTLVERPQDLWMRVAINLFAKRILELNDEIEKLSTLLIESDFILRRTEGPSSAVPIPWDSLSPEDQAIVNREKEQELQKSKLIKRRNELLERIWCTYDLLSTKKYSHASPTLFNLGTPHQQCCSCFVGGSDDSLEGIVGTLSNAVTISKFGGGFGGHFSDWRSSGSLIRGTGGKSKGIVNFIRMFDTGARAFDQGGDKRKGAFAMYLETWHPDIEAFLNLGLKEGSPLERAHDLFYGLFISDHFMEAVQNDDYWYLLDPDECPGLVEAYGDTFVALYESYVKDGKYRRKIRAIELWDHILTTQIEVGHPYILYKDSINHKSNFKHYKPIKSSNLCTEIVLPSDCDEYSVCVLGAINLPVFVIEASILEEEDKIEREQGSEACREVRMKRLRTPNYSTKLRPDNPVFDFKGCADVQRIITHNVDATIDITYIPITEAYIGVLLHRALGLGVCGLGEAYLKMKLPFESSDAAALNKMIFETLSYASLSESAHMARMRAPRIVVNAEEKITRKAKLEDLRSVCDEVFALIEKHQKIKSLRVVLSKSSLGFGASNRQGIIDPYALTREIHKLEEETEPFVPRLKELCAKLPFYPSLLFGNGAPILEGEFQWKLWGLKPEALSGAYDWVSLYEEIKLYGIRNATLLACMPTASISQILGTIESIEPYTYNNYMKETLAGVFNIVNHYLLEDIKPFMKPELKNHLRNHFNSIETYKDLPQQLKDLHRPCWEISQKTFIDQAIGRGPFICQSQSMNIHKEAPSKKVLSKIHFHAWKNGAKTGSYYIRTRPATSAQKVNLTLTSTEKRVSTERNINLEIVKRVSERGFTPDLVKDDESLLTPTLKPSSLLRDISQVILIGDDEKSPDVGLEVGNLTKGRNDDSVKIKSEESYISTFKPVIKQQECFGCG